ncbi:MAG: hypothetical protein LBT53_09040 [Puniceicoccales bacterium]|jgi:zinc protease|nr:hypothetical protein [Puniceicoccales bacterium]
MLSLARALARPIRLIPLFARLFALLAPVVFLAGCAAPQYSIIELGTPYSLRYAVVVSQETLALADWREVAETFAKNRNAKLFTYKTAAGVASVREKLAAEMPFYTAFVARPEECGRAYIAEIHRLTRRLDDDPWLDTQWGVITGTDAASAAQLANAAPPLKIQRALSTTKLDDRSFSEYFSLSDDTPGGWSWKKPDGTFPRGCDDLGKPEVAAWAEHFNTSPDLVVTSSNGGENFVEMPYGRGAVRVSGGLLHAIADLRQTEPSPDAMPLLASNSPKVFFPVGNGCAGHITGKDSLVPVLTSKYGVRQIAAYTVPTVFGRGGWGVLNLWQTLPGRNSFIESFFFNQQHMLHDITQITPDALEYKPVFGEGEASFAGHVAAMVDAKLKFDPRNLRRGGTRSPDYQLAGLLWDIDTVAFYGDPSWQATFRSSKEIPGFVAVGLTSRGTEHVLSMEVRNPAMALQSTAPIGLVFTTRLKNIALLEGKEYGPIIADNFILITNPKPRSGEKEIIVRFRGEPILPSKNTPATGAAAAGATGAGATGAAGAGKK